MELKLSTQRFLRSLITNPSLHTGLTTSRLFDCWEWLQLWSWLWFTSPALANDHHSVQRSGSQGSARAFFTRERRNSWDSRMSRERDHIDAHRVHKLIRVSFASFVSKTRLTWSVFYISFSIYFVLVDYFYYLVYISFLFLTLLYPPAFFCGPWPHSKTAKMILAE